MATLERNNWLKLVPQDFGLQTDHINVIHIFKQTPVVR